MKSIPLTQGKFALVDDEDFEYLNQFKWFAYRNSNVWYAHRWENRKMTLMHRVIAKAHNGASVDHRDGNGLHNWRANLRICTQAENSRNRKKGRNNTTGYKGVTFEFGKYRARIKVDYTVIDLGRFSIAEEAARAYDKAAIQYHGEFANLNFPE